MTYLRYDRFDEALTAESGIDGHHQYEVAELNGGAEGFRRGGGVDGDPGLGPSVPNHLQSSLEVWLGLLMDGDHVRPGIEEGVDIALRLLDHQMTVERQLADSPAGLYDRRPHGDIRHEMTVHHVEMEKVGVLLDARDFFGELREIGGQERWGDLDFHGCPGGCSTIAVSS